ncbi:MAG: hypothetical protein JXR37_34335 [Kiritimatiellae bacterium]|nr:hypothetical protein [Kiritimatiellia bacterium]
MPEQMRIEGDTKRLLLVEGKDAKKFFEVLVAQLGLPGVQVMDFRGTTQLASAVKAVRNMARFDAVETVGIVRDVEKNPTGAFQSVTHALRQAGLPVPKEPFVFAEDTPRTCAVILPDASTPGMIETICLKSVQDDPVMPCVQQYLTCVEAAGELPANLDKARAHAYLAAQKKPWLRLGEAAEAGYWQLDHNTFDDLKAFLRAL